MSWRAPRPVLIAAMMAGLLASAPARSDERRDRAAQAFEEGERAFAAGAYERAAEAFEQAYRIAPHSSALVNAAKARRRAGDRTRAADLYARVAAESSDATDREEALAALSELEPSLAKVTVRASDAKVDGVTIEPSRPTRYLAPGEHVLEGRVGQRSVTKTFRVAAGDVTTMTLTVEDLPSAAPRGSVAAIPRAEGPPRGGLPPVVTYVLGGATIVAGGVLVWSGLDVLDQKRRFDVTGADADLDDGLAKQRRTNVVIGVTVGLAALTAVAALLTDWTRHAQRTSSL